MSAETLWSFRFQVSALLHYGGLFLCVLLMFSILNVFFYRICHCVIARWSSFHHILLKIIRTNGSVVEMEWNVSSIVFPWIIIMKCFTFDCSWLGRIFLVHWISKLNIPRSENIVESVAKKIMPNGRSWRSSRS